MEPSQDLAPAGEFNGTESGWTTYIGSPIHNEFYSDDEQSVEYGNNYKDAHENIDDDEDKGQNNGDNNKETDDEGSYDSMTSDASSGPSHLQHVCINSEGGHGLNFTEHTENDHKKIITAKRVTKQVRKTKFERMVEKEEGSLLVADSAASHV